MTRAHASDRAEDGAVYETEAATVSVRQRRADGDRSVLEYAVETNHSAPVGVSVRQPIPDAVAIDDLDFPGECADDWERDGDALRFERDVAPGATVRTAWGVEGDLADDLEPPEVEADPVSIELDDEFEIDETVLDDAAAGDRATDDGSATGTDPDAAADREESDVEADAKSDAEIESEVNTGGADPVLDLEDPQADAGGNDGAAPAPASDSDAEDGSSVLEAPPELDDLATTPEDEAFSIPETGDATEEGDAPTGADATGAEEADSDSGAAQTTTEGVTRKAQDGAADDRQPEGTDSIVRQLVAELHGEELDDSHRAALVDALEVRLSESTNAFVEHVRERQRRRADRIEDGLDALEESVDSLYGLKADANEIATLKRAITRLDDAKATDDDLRELRARVQDIADVSAEQETVEALRADHGSLSASLDATEEELATLADDIEADREAIRDEVATVADDLDEFEERAATEERVDTVADDLATLRDAAATEAALADLEATVEDLEDATATEDDLAELRSELESVESRLEERIDLLEDRHEDLAAESATDAALESLRADHRDRINGQASELQALRETLEDEYSSDEALGETLDRRVHRSLAHLVAFAIGAVGLVSTVPLAIAGSPAAAVTFLGGTGVLGLWWHAVGPAGLDGNARPTLRERIR